MKRIHIIADVMRDQVHGNGFLWGVLAIVGLVCRTIVAKSVASYVGAPGLNLGSAFRVNGVKHIRFGSDVFARSNLWLEAVTRYQGRSFTPSIVIGDRVMFSDSVHVTAINRITIGDDVLFGSGVFVSDHNHGSYAGNEQSSPDEPPVTRALHSAGAVVIEANVWIGDNVNIVGPVTIGFGAVIAANSVVRNDVPARTIVAGAPARVIKSFDPQSGRWLPA
jgi:lipopolysaccharide O-acetyltransferase